MASWPPSRFGPSAIQTAFRACTVPHSVSAWVRAALFGAFQTRRPESVSAMNSGGQRLAKRRGRALASSVS